MTKQPFEADTGRVLNIVINSLYSEKEIFLRELISNSSDAIDKRRFQKLTGKSNSSDSADYEIQIEVSSKEQILSIRDNGIGMRSLVAEWVAQSWQKTCKDERNIDKKWDLLSTEFRKSTI